MAALICEECRYEMAERRATDDAPYLYALGGEWHLYGITVYECPKCKAQAPVIPRMPELHRLMAKILVQKPSPLTGSEIRFLRKNAGLAAKDLAIVLGISPEHLSRVETGKHDALGTSADKLVRLLATDGRAIEGLRLLAKIKSQQKRQPGRKFRLIRGGWKAA